MAGMRTTTSPFVNASGMIVGGGKALKARAWRRDIPQAAPEPAPTVAPARPAMEQATYAAEKLIPMKQGPKDANLKFRIGKQAKDVMVTSQLGTTMDPAVAAAADAERRRKQAIAKAAVSGPTTILG